MTLLLNVCGYQSRGLVHKKQNLLYVRRGICATRAGTQSPEHARTGGQLAYVVSS